MIIDVLAALLALTLILAPVGEPARAQAPEPAKRKLQIEHSGEKLILTNVEKFKDRTYYELKPGGWVSVTVEGPTLINIRVRQLLKPDASGEAQLTVTSVRDEEHVAELVVLEPPDAVYRIKNLDLVPTKLKKFQFDVPEGLHVYRLVVDDAARLGAAVRVTRSKKRSAKHLVSEARRPAAAPVAASAPEPAPAAEPTPPSAGPATATAAPAHHPTPAAEPAPAGSPVPARGKLKPLRVVLYDLNAAGLDEKLVGLLTESLLTEIRKLRKVSVMGMAEIGALLSLEEQKQLLGCNDGECLAEIAGALGGDNLVLGNLGKMGENLVLSLKRLDMRTTGMLKAFNKTIKGGDNEEALLAVIGPSVETLFEEYPLRPGLKRGVSPELAKRLNPPPLPTWVFWLTASSAAVAGLASGGMKVWHHQEVVEYNHRGRQSEGGQVPVSAGELLDIERNVETTRYAYIGLAAAAGALALTAGIEALFTDWWGYGDDPVTPVAPMPASGPVDAAATAHGE